MSRDKKFGDSARPAVLLASPGEPRIMEVGEEGWRAALLRVLDQIVL
jgi:hypothetical protein